ncbi:MAG: hypothetical protein ABFC80_02470 [Coriobacteriales bacterium]
MMIVVMGLLAEQDPRETTDHQSSDQRHQPTELASACTVLKTLFSVHNEEQAHDGGDSNGNADDSQHECFAGTFVLHLPATADARRQRSLCNEYAKNRFLRA